MAVLFRRLLDEDVPELEGLAKPHDEFPADHVPPAAMPAVRSMMR